MWLDMNRFASCHSGVDNALACASDITNKECDLGGCRRKLCLLVLGALLEKCCCRHHFDGLNKGIKRFFESRGSSRTGSCGRVVLSVIMSTTDIEVVVVVFRVVVKAEPRVKEPGE